MTRRQITVYPDPDAVAALGGHHSPLISQAIESFAALQASATENLETALKRDDWIFLAEALKNSYLRPNSSYLSERLAKAVEDAAKRDGLVFSVYGDSTGRRPQVLAAMVRRMDHLHAGVILWSLQWLWEYGRDLEVSLCEWWKPGFRQAYARRHGKLKRFPALRSGKLLLKGSSI
jgi:hypothetical protein